MTLSTQKFSNLCENFLFASRAHFDYAAKNRKPLSTEEESAYKERNKGFIPTSLRLAFNEGSNIIGQFLPKGLGKNYFSFRRLVDKTPTMLMAEAKVDFMLTYTPQVKNMLAYKLPVDLRTKAALAVAKEHNMPQIASLIETALEA